MTTRAKFVRRKPITNVFNRFVHENNLLVSLIWAVGTGGVTGTIVNNHSDLIRKDFDLLRKDFDLLRKDVNTNSKDLSNSIRLSQKAMDKKLLAYLNFAKASNDLHQKDIDMRQKDIDMRQKRIDMMGLGLQVIGVTIAGIAAISTLSRR